MEKFVVLNFVNELELRTTTPVEAILGLGYCIEILPVTVEVQRGDTLIGLAKKYYEGDSSRYEDIARHNEIKDPNLIRVGQVLELPGKTYEQTRLVSVTDVSLGMEKYCR